MTQPALHAAQVPVRGSGGCRSRDESLKVSNYISEEAGYV